MKNCTVYFSKDGTEVGSMCHDTGLGLVSTLPSPSITLGSTDYVSTTSETFRLVIHTGTTTTYVHKNSETSLLGLILSLYILGLVIAVPVVMGFYTVIGVVKLINYLKK